MLSNSKILLSTILIYSLYIYTVVSTKHNIIQGHKFICATYDAKVVNVTCTFKKVNRTTQFWSFDGYYAPGLNTTDNLFVKVTVYARQQNLEWRPHMVIDYIVNICKYMDGSLANKVVDILADGFKKSSNFMHRCPHEGHFYLRNMTFNDEHFPSIVPPADIYIDFQYFMYVNGTVKKMMYLRPYLEVKTKGILYFK